MTLPLPRLRVPSAAGRLLNSPEVMVQRSVLQLPTRGKEADSGSTGVQAVPVEEAITGEVLALVDALEAAAPPESAPLATDAGWLLADGAASQHLTAADARLLVAFCRLVTWYHRRVAALVRGGAAAASAFVHSVPCSESRELPHLAVLMLQRSDRPVALRHHARGSGGAEPVGLAGSVVLLHDRFAHFTALAKQLCRVCAAQVRPCAVPRSVCFRLCVLRSVRSALARAASFARAAALLASPVGLGCRAGAQWRRTLGARKACTTASRHLTATPSLSLRTSPSRTTGRRSPRARRRRRTSRATLRSSPATPPRGPPARRSTCCSPTCCRPRRCRWRLAAAALAARRRAARRLARAAVARSRPPCLGCPPTSHTMPTCYLCFSPAVFLLLRHRPQRTLWTPPKWCMWLCANPRAQVPIARKHAVQKCQLSCHCCNACAPCRRRTAPRPRRCRRRRRRRRRQSRAASRSLLAP